MDQAEIILAALVLTETGDIRPTISASYAETSIVLRAVGHTEHADELFQLGSEADELHAIAMRLTEMGLDRAAKDCLDRRREDENGMIGIWDDADHFARQAAKKLIKKVGIERAVELAYPEAETFC